MWSGSIVEMQQRKQLAKNLASKVNEKPKAFMKLISESFVQEDQAKVAAKVLMYSRSVEMDKIAECLGGKDEIHKQVFDEYLLRQDYSDNHIEKQLRSFMQTFRMAGIESQVVFRILESFGQKCYERDNQK